MSHHRHPDLVDVDRLALVGEVGIDCYRAAGARPVGRQLDVEEIFAALVADCITLAAAVADELAEIDENPHARHGSPLPPPSRLGHGGRRFAYCAIGIAVARDWESLQISWILDDNAPMLSTMARLPAPVTGRWRIYVAPLPPPRA